LHRQSSREAELAAGSPPQRNSGHEEVATRAGEIVRELLTYAGQGAASFTSVDLSVLVEEMQGLLKISIAKHATLKVGRPNLPALRAARRLRQVVMNLITNASSRSATTKGSSPSASRA
jgi:C4-dicarboxylate-specific signal transduction histidine kinase